jgi:hypothetical protein
MDFYSILKTALMMATGIFGIIGVLTKYKDEKGNVNRWGKIAMAGIVLSAIISLALFELESIKATEGAKEEKTKFQETRSKLDATLYTSHRLMDLQRASLQKSQELERNLQATANSMKGLDTANRQMSDRQSALLTAQTKLGLWQLRGYFRIEPLNIYFEREYSMDDPALVSYVERVRAGLVEEGEEVNMAKSHLPYLLTDDEWPEHQYMKPTLAGEPEAYKKLLIDRTAFVFSGPGKNIEFICSTSSLKHAFNGIVERETPREEILLWGDFANRTIKQGVSCENPGRAGDFVSLSAIDLVGRTLRWYRLSFEDPPEDSGNILHIRLNFPFDLGWQTFQGFNPDPRDIYLNKGQDRVKITADHLGLRGTLKGISG